MSSITKEGNKAYPSIPEITEDPYTHTIALQAIKEALATHERRDRAVADSFVRFQELVDLGVIDSEGESILENPDWVNLPETTTSVLEDVSSFVNRDARKRGGTVFFNATTSKPVYAVGTADDDVWVDATGATVHTPI